MMNHKGLTYIFNWTGLMEQQAHQLEKLSKFNFCVLYIPGAKNILFNTLFYLYEFDALGTIHTPGEYLQHDLISDNHNDWQALIIISAPLLVNLKALALTPDTSESTMSGMPAAM